MKFIEEHRQFGGSDDHVQELMKLYRENSLEEANKKLYKDITTRNFPPIPAEQWFRNMISKCEELNLALVQETWLQKTCRQHAEKWEQTDDKLALQEQSLFPLSSHEMAKSTNQ